MSKLKRIIWHWTAGADGIIEDEWDVYHFLVHDTGKVSSGKHKPEANINVNDGKYAAHTRRLNTGSISISLDAMADAQESPFEWGTNPITPKQVKGLVMQTADLCETYDIPVGRKTTLSHAEVPIHLGVVQRGKWDITILPGMTRPVSPVEVGDHLRQLVSNELKRRRVVVGLPWWRKLINFLRNKLKGMTL